MNGLSTHVLDTARGRPAAGLAVRIETRDGTDTWRVLGNAVTGDDGRIANLLPSGTKLEPRVYRLVFDTGTYFRAHGEKGFYPHVAVQFEIADLTQHYHIPLLLSPFGYSTYRGS